MERQGQNRSDPNSGEGEILFLLVRLFELAGNLTPRHRVSTIPSRQLTSCNEACYEMHPEAVVLQVEHGGIYYKLVRTEALPCHVATLSPREQEIVRLVSSGYANKTIAHKLAISQHTVNTHVRRIFGKLGVNTRAEMVAYALQTGLVQQVMRYN